MAPSITAAAAAALYLLASIWHWRRLGNADGTTGSSALLQTLNRRATGTPYWDPLTLLGGPAVVLHGICTASLLSHPGGVDFNIMAMAVGVFWVIALFSLLANVKLPISNMLLLIFPLCAIVLLAALATSRFDSSAELPSTAAVLSTPLLSHIVISIAAYSILSMAALQSVLLGVQEHQLQNRQVQGIARYLPPMETMERLLFSLLWVGLATLTVAIASGFAFLDDMFAQNISHHTVLACLAWVVFAVLLYGHKVLGWRGYTAVRWTLAGFVLLLLGYFGSKFVAEVLLQA